MDIKPGIKTSEFWAVVVPLLLSVLHALHVPIATSTSLEIAQAAGVAYAALRTVLKILHVKTLARLSADLQSIAAASPIVKEGKALVDLIDTTANSAPVAAETKVPLEAHPSA